MLPEAPHPCRRQHSGLREQPLVAAPLVEGAEGRGGDEARRRRDDGIGRDLDPVERHHVGLDRASRRASAAWRAGGEGAGAGRRRTGSGGGAAGRRRLGGASGSGSPARPAASGRPAARRAALVRRGVSGSPESGGGATISGRSGSGVSSVGSSGAGAGAGSSPAPGGAPGGAQVPVLPVPSDTPPGTGSIRRRRRPPGRSARRRAARSWRRSPPRRPWMPSPVVARRPALSRRPRCRSCRSPRRRRSPAGRTARNRRRARCRGTAGRPGRHSRRRSEKLSPAPRPPLVRSMRPALLDAHPLRRVMKGRPRRRRRRRTGCCRSRSAPRCRLPRRRGQGAVEADCCRSRGRSLPAGRGGETPPVLTLLSARRSSPSSAGERRHRAELGLGQVGAASRVVVAGAEVDPAVDDRRRRPSEGVDAEAHQDVAADGAAGDRDRVGAAAHADVAADRAAREDDGVVAEAGDEIAVDRAVPTSRRRCRRASC